MPVKSGVVEKVYEKDGMYNLIIDGEFYSTYKTKPSCGEGDSVSFDFTKRGRFNNVDLKTFEVSKSSPPPVHAAEGSGVNRQDIIQYQSARNTALEFMNLLVTTGGLKLAGKEADRYSQLMGMLHELTDQFFQEAGQLGAVEAVVVDDAAPWGDE